MAVTCQHCGTEAPDDRVMCPNCRKRMRPADEAQAVVTDPVPGVSATSPDVTPPETASVIPPDSPSVATGNDAPPPPPPWGAAPVPAASGEPPRPQVLFARETTVKVSRVLVLFRFFLAIPHLIVLYALGIAAAVVAFIGWFAALFTGRLPDGMHDFIAGVVRWQTRVNSYLYLLTDRYPPFALSGEDDYPIQYSTTHEPLNRVAVFFRFILVVPAMLLVLLIGYGYFLISIVKWFIALILGRVPVSLFDLSANVIRYSARISSYYFLLTPAYPAGLFKDDQDRYAEDADVTTPQPPRHDTGARGLITTSIVLGAAAIVAFIVVIAVLVGGKVHTLNDLRTAHNKVVAADQSATQCSPGDLACLHTDAAQQAAAFKAFGDTLATLDVPSSAEEEKAALAATTDAVVRLWQAIENSQSTAAASRLLSGGAISTAEGTWNEDYQALDDAVVAG